MADHKRSVGILGATGAVGQRFIQLLADHPWFEVAEVAASDRSLGRPFREACVWRLPGSLPAAVSDMEVRSCEGAFASELLFSGLDSSVAGRIESDLAARGHVVVSNAKNHRMGSDVPLLIPEVNPDHLDAIPVQRRRTGGGFIVTNPNCSVAGLALVLSPIHRAFGLESVAVVTLQALSGAGYPGVASLDACDNVVPYVGGGEENKIETEPQKILGTFEEGAFRPASFTVTSSVHRVGVSDGHLMTAFLDLSRPPSASELAERLAGFRGEPQELRLPSAPSQPIQVLSAPDRPQPRLDRDCGGGMVVSVGRIREDALFDFKLEILVHNTVRGAAGAAILNAEALEARHLIPGTRASRVSQARGARP